MGQGAARRHTQEEHRQGCAAKLLTYLRELEDGGVLKEGSSTVDIDVDRQEAYLKSIGVDTSEMDEQEIREYNTDGQVFIRGGVSILDAMEDVDVEMHY